MLNGRNLNLPIGLVAGQTVVAGFAAVGILYLMTSGSGRISPILLIALTAIIAAGLVTASRKFFDEVRAEAFTHAAEDPATGLSTAAAADRVLELEFAAAQRGRPLTIVLLRIEDTAGYTLRHGRAAAEQLLRRAAIVLRKHRRSMHVTAHQPAEGTYISIMSGMEPSGACVYARRVRKDLKRIPGLPEAAVVSAGIVPFDLSMRSPAVLMSMAERALERGTRAGGKVVVVGSQDGKAAKTA